MPQIRGIKDEVVPPLAGLRVLDNKEDGVSSAFLKGKQNGIIYLYLICRSVMKIKLNLLK